MSELDDITAQTDREMTEGLEVQSIIERLRSHVQALAKVPNADVLAACDIIDRQAQQIKAKDNTAKLDRSVIRQLRAELKAKDDVVRYAQAYVEAPAQCRGECFRDLQRALQALKGGE